MVVAVGGPIVEVTDKLVEEAWVEVPCDDASTDETCEGVLPDETLPWDESEGIDELGVITDAEA